MLRKLLGVVLLLMGSASAHIKPVPHGHVGLLHTEDMALDQLPDDHSPVRHWTVHR